MRLRTLVLLVALFCGGFYWAGGQLSTLVNSDKRVQLSQFVDTGTALSRETVGTASRLIRLFSIKDAVAQARQGKTLVPLPRIPLAMQQAILAMEDQRFYQHWGLDPEGILRATLVNLQSGDVVEGGSTITQQLAKNLFLSQEQTLGRKFEEALLALALERAYTKEELLELYLNSIYFGSGAWGIADASQRYFAKTPNELSLAECALLAGLPNAPSLTSPLEHPQAARQRRQLVLDTMVRRGLVGPKQAQEAAAQPLVP